MNTPTRIAALWACTLLASCVASGDAPELWEASVTIESVPLGAQIVWFRAASPELPGGPVELGDSPVTWEASRAIVGAHESVNLVAFQPGYGRAQVEVPITALRTGEPITIAIPEFATLEVESDPIATFSLVSAEGVTIVDGVYAPRVIEELSPGTYALSASRDGYAAHAAQIVVRAGERAAARYALEPLPAPPDGEPRMSVRPGTVSGIAPDLFYPALQARLRNVSGCYDRAIASNPLAAGEIHVRLDLNLQFGRVDAAHIVETEISDPEALDCVQRRLRAVEFVPPGGAGPASAELTIRYHRIPPQ